MKKHTLAFIILTGCLLIRISAQSNTDSLEIRLPETSGTERIELLLKLSELLQDSIPEKAKEYANICYREIAESMNIQTQKNIYSRLGNVFKRTLEYYSAINCYKKALELMQTASDQKGMVNMLVKIGSAYHRLGNYDESLQNYQLAFKLAEEINYLEMRVASAEEMARINITVKNYGKGLEYLDIALSLSGENPYNENLFSIYNTYGYYYNNRKDFEKALEYHFKALDIAQKDNNGKWTSYSLNNIGLVYISMGSYQQAYDYYLRSLQIKEKSQDPWGMVSAYVNLSTALVRQKKFEGVEDYLQKGLQITKKLKSKVLFRDLYDTYYEYYTAKGRYKEALENYEMSNAYRDSMLSESKTMEISELQKKYENEAKEREYDLLKQKERHQAFVKKILIAGIVLLFLVSGTIVWNVLMKRRKDRIIAGKEKQLMQAELEKHDIASRELRKEVEFRTRQLTTHALNMTQKNKMLAVMTRQIDELIHDTSGEVKSPLRQLRRQIKQNLKTESDWEVFRMYFEQVNAGFFETLTKINPDFNTYDLRHCALIKLNLNIKESASVLSLSPNSVKSARYRLKKKLFLKPEESLYDFLRDI